jgi:membrane protein implicated in regulation of membrane protease activity
MFTVFVFLAVVGWIFVAIFLFASADFDVDLDIDADFDLDLDADAGTSIADSGLSLLGALFSFRSLVFFMAFFGLTGMVMTWLGAGTALAVILAVAIGLFTAYINTKLMRYLRRTSVSSRLPDSRIAGNAATVVVPISDDSRGKVSVDVNGQRLYLIATPFAPGRGDTYAIGDTVVIVEVDRGSALVTAMDDLD